MNKTLKARLRIFLIFILIIVSLFIWTGWHLNQKEKQAEVDEKEQSMICDRDTLINQQLKVHFYSFNMEEIEKVHFYLVRNNTLQKDTVIFCGTEEFDFPFKGFKKTDTVIVKTKSNLYFNLSGFRYRAHLHYGNFGYLGSWDCRFACNINDALTNDRLNIFKDDASEVSVLPSLKIH